MFLLQHRLLFHYQTSKVEVNSLKYIKRLKLAHPINDNNDKFEVSLLIGADYYWQSKVVRGNRPTALKSKIGYFLSGPLQVTKLELSVNHMLNVITTQPIDIDLERFWKLESMGISSKKVQASTSHIMDMYKENSIKCNNEHYVAKLPWKDDHPVLPMNNEICQKCTENTIHRLLKKPELLHKYGLIIEDQL